MKVHSEIGLRLFTESTLIFVQTKPKPAADKPKETSSGESSSSSTPAVSETAVKLILEVIVVFI